MNPDLFHPTDACDLPSPPHPFYLFICPSHRLLPPDSSRPCPLFLPCLNEHLHSCQLASASRCWGTFSPPKKHLRSARKPNRGSAFRGAPARHHGSCSCVVLSSCFALLRIDPSSLISVSSNSLVFAPSLFWKPSFQSPQGAGFQEVLTDIFKDSCCCWGFLLSGNRKRTIEKPSSLCTNPQTSNSRYKTLKVIH